MRYDRTKLGWELLEHVPHLVDFSVSNLEPVSLLKEGEISISREEVRKRAKELGANFGQETAEYLVEHQNEIPDSWHNLFLRDQLLLAFPGTLWHTHVDGPPYTGLRIPFFIPNCGTGGGRWILRFYAIELVGRDIRFLCPKE